VRPRIEVEGRGSLERLNRRTLEWSTEECGSLEWCNSCSMEQRSIRLVSIERCNSRTIEWGRQVRDRTEAKWNEVVWSGV
jgi:hypothetical protein